MRIGLFIPCYIDQFYPQVGMATVKLLEHLAPEATLEFPEQQTCCGQPMANTGCVDQARPLAHRFFELFSGYDYVVCPSGSCTAMVRHHYDDYLSDRAGFAELKSKTKELCEFLVGELKIEHVPGKYAHRVGLHQSCHGLRELRLASASELVAPQHDTTRQLLASIDQIELTSLERPDECCGFGGTFAINEEAVSCMMGDDRIHDHEQAGTEILTANDMSCLMHLDGIIRRKKKNIKVKHVAEVLWEATESSLNSRVPTRQDS